MGTLEVLLLLAVCIALLMLLRSRRKASSEGFDASADGSPPATTELLLLKADWCGFCRRLRPVWDEAVTLLRAAPDLTRRLRVRVVDHTEPDFLQLASQLGAQTLPSVWLLPGGAGKAVKVDHGGADARELLRRMRVALEGGGLS
jgi:thiol-disulfide isomerase/thioredoxin